MTDREAPRRDARPSAAVRAEPSSIGSAGARPLAAEVRLLGALLGQVITEQAGTELFELVERVRKRMIALRRADDPIEREQLADELASLDLDRAEAVIRAFLALLPAGEPLPRSGSGSAAGPARTCLAHRGAGPLARRRHPPAAAHGSNRRRARPCDRAAGDLAGPTAHPTEARRRTLLSRCGGSPHCSSGSTIRA